MRQRLTTAAGGLTLAFIVLAFAHTFFLNLTVALISVLAVDELFKTVGLSENKAVHYLSLAISAVIPLAGVNAYKDMVLSAAYIYIILLFSLMIKYHKTFKIEQVGFALMSAVFLPVTFATTIYTRDIFGRAQGVFFIVFCLASAWIADAGGYFFGMAFGKRKLAPEISPKKTVEGALGGAVSGLVGTLLFCFLFARVSPLLYGELYSVNYLAVALASPVLTVLSIIGDLFASVIKRQHNVKDFGSIMPGHGGVMDRFDSLLLVFPTVYLLNHFFPLLTRL